MHSNGVPYLTIIDNCSSYTVARELKNESNREVVSNLREVFAELGPPTSILSDNGTVFRSRMFRTLLHEWSIIQQFSCAYRAKGNGIVERVHRTIKRASKRAGSTIADAVFWFNNTTSQSGSCPYEIVFSAKSKKPGINEARI